MNRQDGKKLAALLQSSVKGVEEMTKILEKSLNDIQPDKVDKEVYDQIKKEVSVIEGEILSVKQRHDEIINKL